MRELNQIYKCKSCGNLLELVSASGGGQVCCEQDMELLVEKSGEEGTEKHKPVIDGQKIKVGSIPHPMEPEHHIEWIEVLEEDDVSRKNLMVGTKPEAEFCNKNIKSARAYCNIHGLWKN